MTNESYVLHYRSGFLDPYDCEALAPGRSRITATQTRVTRTDTSIMIATQELRTGLTATSVPWTRWGTPRQEVLKAKTLVDGTTSVNLTTKASVRVGGRNTTIFRTKTSSPYDVDRFERTVRQTPNPDMFFDFLKEHTGYVYEGDYGSKSFRSLLPAANLWFPNEEMTRGGLEVGLITKAMRQRTLEDFVTTLYGKTRYRKDLVRAVASTTLEDINRLSVFIGVVPIDWQIEALRMSADLPDTTQRYIQFLKREGSRTFRAILRRMTPHRQRRLIHELSAAVIDGNPFNHILVDDVFRLLVRRELEHLPRAVFEARTFQEMHRALVAENIRAGVLYNGNMGANYAAYARLPFVNKQIPGTPNTYAIEGVDMGDVRFICAHDTQMMKDWGDYMHNCIGSYADTAVSGDGIYIGAYQGETLVANIELKLTRHENEYDLRQILGKYNHNLDDALRDKLVEGLKSTHLLNEKSITSAWGMPRPVVVDDWGIQGNIIGGDVVHIAEPAIRENVWLDYGVNVINNAYARNNPFGA